MRNPSEPEEKFRSSSNQLVVKLINSKFVGWLANLPLIAGFLRWIAQRVLRGQFGKSSVSIDLGRRVGSGLQFTLEQIVKDVVEELDYVGAMLATYETPEQDYHSHHLVW
jgi:hypothetical protein